MAITSDVWPDAQTSIEPVYYGAGSDVMAFLMTYHQHGAQKHQVEGWLKELVEHPSNVLRWGDVRHWSERQAVMLCMQTSDTSIELYWKDGMLRSRHGSGLTPSSHIPVVEDFADRLARKMHGEQGALWFEVVNRTASAHFIGGMPIAPRTAWSIPTSAPSDTRDCTRWTAAHAGESRGEPVGDDHGAC